MLVPHNCTGTNAANQTVREQYEQERGAMSFEADERNLTITAANQPCETFALHDELSLFKQLYNEKSLAFFANTGVINQNDMNKGNYRDKTETQLFAHDAMQEETRKVDPYNSAPGTGVLGRAAGVLTRQGLTTNALSIDNPSVAVNGFPGESPDPLIVSRSGAKSFNPGSGDQSYLDFATYIENLNNKTTSQSSIYGETWSDIFFSGIQDSERLKASMASVPLPTTIWDPNEEGSELYQKFSTIYKLIKSRADRGSDLDVLYTSFGGWDHHNAMKASIRPKFQALNKGLEMFVNQLKAENLWNNVTIVVTSDFARTITPNNNIGSDHAWGGHYPFLGGSVKGGVIHGQYPDDITPAGPLNIGRGRIIPTLSWDAVWNGVIDHMGVSASDMDEVLPNRANTLDEGFQLFTKEDLFGSTIEAATTDNFFVRES